MSEISHPSKPQAEADLKDFTEDLVPFVVAAETARMPMVITDAKQADNSIIFANDSLIFLFGYQCGEILGQGFNFVLASVTDAEPPTPMTNLPNGRSNPKLRARTGTDEITEQFERLTAVEANPIDP